MVTHFERQIIIDEEQLRLLAIGYWVWGGFMALYSLFIVAYFAFIGSIFVMIPSDGGDAPPAFLGWIFIFAGTAVFVVVGGLAALEIATGFWIHRRRYRVATMVVAALLCPGIPFGTLLGVSTFVVMSRPTVKALYAPPGTQPSAWGPPPSATQDSAGAETGRSSAT